MSSVNLFKAKLIHASELTDISCESFTHDSLKYNPEGQSGPEGYDSLSFQEKQIRTGLYYFIDSGNEMAGGLLLRKTERAGHIHVQRVFVKTSFQGRGIGKKAFFLAEKLYPEMTTWTLDTPSWALKNHYFYKSVGYAKLKEYYVPGIFAPFFFYIKNLKFSD